MPVAILFIDGQLVHQQDGDVQFAFQGNSADIAFECILLEDSADNIRPPISPCMYLLVATVLSRIQRALLFTLLL